MTVLSKIGDVDSLRRMENMFRARALQRGNVKQIEQQVTHEGYEQRGQSLMSRGIHNVQLFEKDSKEISLVPREVIL